MSAKCGARCKHGHDCVEHAIKRNTAEVRTHIAHADGLEHRFWHGSEGWHCVTLGPAQISRLDDRCGRCGEKLPAALAASPTPTTEEQQ